jgi:hypothetical protein
MNPTVENAQVEIYDNHKNIIHDLVPTSEKAQLPEIVVTGGINLASNDYNEDEF